MVILPTKPALSLFTLFLISLTLLSPLGDAATGSNSPTVCIIGAGIAGSSVAHFLRNYSDPTDSNPPRIHMFERHAVVGGRMATVTISGDTFEAGASILHPKNFHARSFVKLLNLTVKAPPASEDSFDLGIWDGKGFLFKTITVSSRFQLVKKIINFANSLKMFIRYGFSLFRMDDFVEDTVGRFLKYYESFDKRPVFETVEEMLKWSGLYNLTTLTLSVELLDNVKLSPLLIDELATIITRINYGQSVQISGLAGAVSLAGSGGGLWSIKNGNRQMAVGLIDQSDVTLHLNLEIESVSYLGEYYEFNSTTGESYLCDVAVVATPLDEVNIQFSPPISIPERKLQHTHATFVRGLLNPGYFGLSAVSDIPELVATIEDPELPFTSISVLKLHDANDMTYKIFSRKPMEDAILDSIFSARRETIRINWGAYPHYNAPEVFAPFILDGKHLYYVNAFENAASTMETSAVAAENVARLIISRFFSKTSSVSAELKSNSPGIDILHSDL